MESIGVDVKGLARDLVGPASIESNAANDSPQVATSHGNGLAIVQGLNGREEIKVLLTEICQRVHELATALRSSGLPFSLKSLARSGYSDVDILLCSLRNRGDDLLGRRVNDLESLLVHSFDPFVVDKPAANRSAVNTQSWNDSAVAVCLR
jgi:hypothetical protein